MLCFASLAYADNIWVVDFGHCPTTYQAQTCSGADRVCGYSGGVTYCSAAGDLTFPAANSTTYSTANNGTIDGGKIIDCIAYDGTAPHCDNSAAFWCERNETCHGSPVNRNTVCLGSDSGGDFGISVCGDCKTEGTDYFDCYGDTNCESTSTSDCENSNNNHYITATCNTGMEGGASGTCECDTNYFACDGSITDADGCEHLAGASCGSGTGTKVDDECYDASNANCTSAVNSDCDNDDSDSNLITCNGGNGCEITGGGSCGSGTGTYVNSQCNMTVGNCTATAGNHDCNNDDGDGDENVCNGPDGCEITDGAACSVGALSGVYDGCDGASGNCVVSPMNHTTGQPAEYSSANPNLWSVQFGSGWLLNLTNGFLNLTWGINNTGCVIWNDGTSTCSNPSAGGATISNNSISVWSNRTYLKNETIDAQLLLNSSYAFLGSENVTINDTLAILWTGAISVADFTNVAYVNNSNTFNQNNSFDNLNTYFGNRITHLGDVDTYVTFPSEDRLDLIAGGAQFITLDEDGTDRCIINANLDPIDFNVRGNSDISLIYTNSSTDNVGIGTPEPSSKLEVDGDIKINATYAMCFSYDCVVNITNNGSALIITG